MEYHNPQIPEGINVTPGHPVKTFFKLFAAIALILALAAWLLGQSGSWLAARVPFDKELKLSKLYTLDEPESSHAEMQAYLDSIAKKLIPAMQLPEGMQISVHYESEDVENAFASLGGHIFLYKGLLKRLKNEDSIAMLMAHEMAHVKLRHPIRAAGQKAAITTGMKLLLGFSDVKLLGNAGLYTELHFSRTMESAADQEGLLAVDQAYGQVQGAIGLYEALKELSGHSTMKPASAFFSTHPLDDQRITRLTRLVKEQGWDEQKGEPLPLPQQFADWL